MSRVLDIVPDSPALYRRAAAAFVRLARESIAVRGRFTVALAGGSTPRGLYMLLAGELESVAWDRTEVFWSDERCVPPDDPASNYRMAREALLAHVPVPDAQVHRVPTERRDAAEAYERTVRSVLPPTGRIDLILLGLGHDGHTASLFPGSPVLAERRRWISDAPGPPPHVARNTFTPVLLDAAGTVLFLVSGAGKAQALRGVLEDPFEPAHWPAQIVRPRGGRVVWLVDEDAAHALTRRTLATAGDGA